MFWTVVLVLVGLVVVGFLVLVAWASLDEAQRRHASDERNGRILEEQRIDRQHRDYLAGHNAGIYGDFAPIDLETGEPIQVTHRERPKLTAKDFKQRFRSS